MKVFFLSDLHLESDASAAAKRFVNFLTHKPVSGDVLLLGGDIFDLLVGNKSLFRERFGKVIAGMEAAAERGVRLYYLEGNHDFHFGGMFRDRKNILVRTDDFEIDADGKKIWISHGDLIDEEDTGYRLLRAFTKNAPFKVFVTAMPGRVVDFIGSRSSGASRKYTTGRVETEGTERIRRLYLDFARGKIEAGYQHVLVGHSHLRDQIPISVGANRGEYINLGFCAEKLAVAVLEPGAEYFEIIEMT